MILYSKNGAKRSLNSMYITSRFQIVIDVKTIIIGHVFIQTKYCVWGGEGTNIVLNKKYDQFSSFLRYNCYLRVNCIVLFKLFT